MIFFLLLGCASGPKETKTAIEGCYYPESAHALMTASTFDPLEVRWAAGVDEICRLSSGGLQVNLKGQAPKTCASSSACPELSEAIFTPAPAETVNARREDSRPWRWSTTTFQQYLDNADEAWAVNYLAQHGGQVTIEDGTELSLISPAQIFINGQSAELDLIKCLVMRDVNPPHQTLCLLSTSGQGYAHVGEWIAIRRAGTEGLDARRAYALNGGSQSYLNTQERAQQ